MSEFVRGDDEKGDEGAHRSHSEDCLVGSFHLLRPCPSRWRDVWKEQVYPIFVADSRTSRSFARSFSVGEGLVVSNDFIRGTAGGLWGERGKRLEFNEELSRSSVEFSRLNSRDERENDRGSEEVLTITIRQ